MQDLYSQVNNMNFGFHAPTMSFPVAGALMVEPTESESKRELDRFCDAMIQIHHEIDEVSNDQMPVEDNPLVNAPHAAQSLLNDDWQRAYNREMAAYPIASDKRE